MLPRRGASLLALLIGIVLTSLWAQPPGLAFTPGRARSPTTAQTTTPAPVVINEVAWGGTAASYADEWIELFNTTALTVSLAGWRLQAADGDPDVALAGEIAPFSFHLIERTDDTTVSSIGADLIAPFGKGLSNNGEILLLRDEVDTIVDTVNADGGPWPTDGEGGAPDYRAMERIDPTAPDDDANWVSNDGSWTTGLDSAGGPITGTPGSHNAAFMPVFENHADLVVTQVGPDIVTAGTVLTYDLTIRNEGGFSAVDVIFTDTLAHAVTLLSQESDLPWTQVGRDLVWSVGTLTPGAREGIVVQVQVDATATAGTWITNAVTGTTASPDLNEANNSATWARAVVVPGADLVVTKIGPHRITDLTPFGYRITITNTGVTTAPDTHVVDALPAVLTVVESATSATSHPVRPERSSSRSNLPPPSRTPRRSPTG